MSADEWAVRDALVRHQEDQAYSALNRILEQRRDLLVALERLLDAVEDQAIADDDEDTVEVCRVARAAIANVKWWGLVIEGNVMEDNSGFGIFYEEGYEGEQDG